MTTEEKLEEMETSIETIIKVQEENGHKLDEVLGCLKGGMGSDGLVKEFSTLKKEVQDLKDKSNTDRTKADIYMGIIKWLAGAITLLVLAYMFNQVYIHK